MSVIEKMSIMGIRSFGPDDQHRQLIEFFKPLTLILGPNGSGKTTIIECLRYMTTGDVPPNSERGASFVHDPKIAGQTEVKGQVKLQLTDVLGKRMIVTRNLVSAQKQKKLQFKTLEGSVTRYAANGEKRTLTSKCADIDKEMVTALGVSKAILNNVIFCHQEESSWPLSEGRALKLKFDDIFAATRYIKALEEIRKIRNMKMADVKLFKAKADNLKENKRKAEEFSATLEKTETRLAACKDSIKGIEEKLRPITEKLTEIAHKEHELSKLQADLESNKKLLLKLEKDQQSLKNSIGTPFMGSKEELQEEMGNFSALVQQKKKQLEKIKRKCCDVEVEQQKLMKSKSKLTEELGKLKAEHKQYMERMQARDSKLSALSNDLGLGEISTNMDDTLDQSQVQTVLRVWGQKMNVLQQQLKDSKEQYDARETSVEHKLDEVKDTLSKKKQEQKTSSEKIMKNKNVIRTIDVELSQVHSMAAMQDDLEVDLADAEDQLDTLQNSIDVNGIKAGIAASQKRRKELESKYSDLSKEMNQLQKESKLRAEIDVVSKEKKSKEDGVDRLVQRHDATVKNLIGNKMPSKNAKDSVKSLMSSLSEEISNISKDLDENRSQSSSLRTSKEFHMQELRKKEELLTSHRSKIMEVCGSQNLDESFTSLEQKVKDLRDETGALSGSLYLFNKYIEKLGAANPCCPLCSRSFQQREEVESLRQNLQKKLQVVPSQLTKKEKLIAEHQKLLNKMLELNPLKEEIVTVSEQEIPELRSKLNKVTDDAERVTSLMLELEDKLDSKQSNLKTANEIFPDLTMLDQNQRELERIERRLSTLTLQLGGGGDISRTSQQVSNEMSDLQSQIESLKNDIENKQQSVTEHSEQVQHLRGQINDFRAKKVEIAGRLQKKTSLEEQLNSLTAENEELQENLKKMKNDFTILEEKVAQFTAEKKEIASNKEKELDQIRNKIKKEEKDMEFVNGLTAEIKRYDDANKGEQLKSHESKIDVVSTNVKEKAEEISRLRKEEKDFEKEISSQQLKYREYEDNIRLFDVQEEISACKEQCKVLDEKVGNFSIRKFLSDKRQLVDQEKQLNKDKSELEGGETVLKERANNLKAQLQDKMFRNAEKEHRDMLIDLRTTELACEDLNKYYIALDRAIMKYHQIKMDEINKLLRELWIKTYAGDDIDYIEIRSSEDESEIGLERSKRVYNYKVVWVKGDRAVDMRGHCSAGQKVIASLLIRLALAEVFCLNCGILALDEPTTNLDRAHICSLAHALEEIVKSRSAQRNFQLIVITHDEDFIDLLGRSETVDYFYKVSKDNNSCSKVLKSTLSEMP